MRTLSCVAAVAGLGLVVGSASAGVRMTHVYQFSTDSSGNAAGGQLWDTLNGGSFAIWVSVNGTPINGSSNIGDATVDFELTQGSYQFEIWGQPGNASTIAFAGMNLFFEDSGAPGISVFAQATASMGDSPSIAAYGGNSTWAPSGIVPGAGSLSYVDTDSGLTVSLVDYFYANPNVFNQDVVSSSVRTPGGGPDYYGRFTLRVVPAPATVAPLAGLVLAMVRRNR
ncbi:MAG: hypothetical protein AAGI53_01780 [Planctomycetota bacterium]